MKEVKTYPFWVIPSVMINNDTVCQSKFLIVEILVQWVTNKIRLVIYL